MPAAARTQEKWLPLSWTALRQAMTAPEAVPLLATRTSPGLFPATVAGKLAARNTLDAGWLRVARTEKTGKTQREYVQLTERGLDALLDQVAPDLVLQQLGPFAASCKEALDGFREQVRRAVFPGSNGTSEQLAPPVQAALLARLLDWQRCRPTEDCPLPGLYAQLVESFPDLTLGRFHDAVRAARAAGLLCLHPWTGPLHEMPRPECALLYGHSIAYYATLRENGSLRSA